MTNCPDLPPLDQLRARYGDQTLAVLFDWLKRPRPPELLAIDLQRPDDALAQRRLSLSGRVMMDVEETLLSNRVARLVLSSIQESLPQSALVQNDGKVILRRAGWLSPLGALTLWPRLLFEINRADALPGFSWAEAYHVTHLPGFESMVVTIALDRADQDGCSELAIGHFPATRLVRDGARAVIRQWWTRRAQSGQPCWAFLFDTGEVDESTAWSWAAEVWDVATGAPRLGLAQTDTRIYGLDPWDPSVGGMNRHRQTQNGEPG